MRITPSQLPGQSDMPNMRSAYGLLPARVLPDNRLNVKSAGIHYTLFPEQSPITVAALRRAIAVISPSTQYDNFVTHLVAQVWPTEDVEQVYTAGTCNPFFDWWVFIKNRTTGTHWTSDFHPGMTLFGTGDYPHQLAIPMVIAANETWEIQIRNDEDFELNFYLEFRSVRKAKIVRV